MTKTTDTAVNTFNTLTVIPSGSATQTETAVTVARTADLKAAQERGLPLNVYRSGYDMKSMG